MYIAGNVSALSTTTIDTIILGIPTSITNHVFIIETSGGYHLPLAVSGNNISRSSTNSVLAGWYSGFDTYITTD